MSDLSKRLRRLTGQHVCQEAADYIDSLHLQIYAAERVLANIDSGTPDYREQAAAYFRDREGEKEEER